MLRYLASKFLCTSDMSVAASILKVAFGAMCLAFCVTVAGPIEGRLWPVTAHITITRMQPMDDGYTLVWGKSRKLRSGCRFDHMEWFIGIPGDDIRTEARILTSPVNRPIGSFDFGPFKIQMTPEQIMLRSHATYFHNCHGFVLFGKQLFRLWLTETEVWPQAKGLL